jgi:flagellar biosynthetic protein FliR
MMESGIINEILRTAPVFLLVAVRALAMIETAPLLSSDAIPQVAKLSLAGFTAYLSFPTAVYAGWTVSYSSLSFVFLVIGEALIGIIIGFYLTIIFAAFSTAGQFFSLQMGFGASETFDPLAQVENPLMGQYLNLIAMLVFLVMDGFQELFLGGFWRSLQSISILNLVEGRKIAIDLMLTGLTRLFLDAIVISMPILGTLFLTSLTTGLISKAAPQINILSEGFPISITVAFLLIMATMPTMVEAFGRAINYGWRTIEQLYVQIGSPIGGTS